MVANVSDIHHVLVFVLGLPLGKEPKILCKKIVNFFSSLSHSHYASSSSTNAGRKHPGTVTQELLALVTTLAQCLKILIRVGLSAALDLVGAALFFILVGAQLWFYQRHGRLSHAFESFAGLTVDRSTVYGGEIRFMLGVSKQRGGSVFSISSPSRTSQLFPVSHLSRRVDVGGRTL